MWSNDANWQVVVANTTEVGPVDGGRVLIAMALALVTATVFQRRMARRGLPAGLTRPWRAFGASVLLTFFLFIGIFVPVAFFDQPPEIDTASLGRLDLFASQLMMLAVLAAWALFAFGEPLPREQEPVELSDVDGNEGPWPDSEAVEHDGPRDRPGVDPGVDPRRDWLAYFGLRTARPETEVRVGLFAGAVAWAVVIATSMVVGGLIGAVAGGDAVATPVSPLIVYLAGLPVIWRLALSVAAGVVEETFFRGFLQPRLGIGISTACFVLGHASYGQPMMLVGLTVLSLLYAWLVRWRGNVWAAIVAHTLFDAVQLLVVVPAALEVVGPATVPI